MANTPPIKTILETSAFDAEARENPYPRLDELRRHCPVFRDELTKIWFLTRYEDVRATVNDRSLWRFPGRAEEGSLARLAVKPIPGLNVTATGTASMLFLDEPDHSRVRQPIAKALYARMAHMRREIDGIVAEVIDRVADSKRFDLMNEVAIPIPILVIARVLGIDEERLADFRLMSEAAILALKRLRSDDETRFMVAGANALDIYFRALMRERREEPKEDLISDLIRMQADGAELSDTEICINLASLLVGGNLTTSDLIGNGVWLLLTHPDELAKLRADPSVVPAAVEEVLRYESPVDSTTRVIPEERKIGGCPMHAGHSVMLSLRAANRDPEVFAEPDRFDITRPRTPHVAFGGGSHICIGAPLARMETQAAFTQIFARFPNLRMAEQELEWRTLPFFRGLQRLIVET